MYWYSFCYIGSGYSSPSPSDNDTSKSPFLTVTSLESLRHSGNIPITEKPIRIAAP